MLCSQVTAVSDQNKAYSPAILSHCQPAEVTDEPISLEAPSQLVSYRVSPWRKTQRELSSCFSSALKACKLCLCRHGSHFHKTGQHEDGRAYYSRWNHDCTPGTAPVSRDLCLVGQGPDGVLFACPGYAGAEHPRGWQLAGIEVNRDKWELDGIQIPEDSTEVSKGLRIPGWWKEMTLCA